MEYINHQLILLLNNFVFIAVFCSWFLAQSIKTIIYWILEKELNIWHFFEAGGMPSTHSATVIALTLSIFLTQGLGSPLFVISSVFSLIVMYDATGVRRSAGKQAEILNKIMEDIYSNEKIKKQKLKEILGHDPVEVVIGGTMGIIVTLILYYVYFIR